MNIIARRPFGQNYAFIVVGIIFLCLLAAAGQRSAPGVLILPLETAFGWSRDTISLSAAIGILLFGLVGPFAAALMETAGLRRTLLSALALMVAAPALSTLMTEPWQLMATWGVMSGAASGAVAIVLGATIVNRWFVKHRGTVMGFLTASTATGTLIFVPGLAALSEHGWQYVAWAVAAVALALIPLVFFLVPERPQSAGLVPYGAPEGTPAPARRTGILAATFGSLARASTTRTFWVLFVTFFICGFTTNGLVGTHLIALCGDQGIPEVRAAGLLALMGLFDLIGTTGSGWLSDRYDPRKLLFVYYGLRGLSLIYLPYSSFDFYSLSIFAVFYGLDWLATVPPTMRLANEAFGERDAPVVFGWIVAGHMLGASCAAFFAGWMRVMQGSYLEAFIIAGATAVIAAFISLMVKRKPAVQVAA